MEQIIGLVNSTLKNSTDSNNLYRGNISTVSDGETDEHTSGLYYIWTLSVWVTVPPIIIAIGTIGNCFTIAIILRRKVKLTSTSLFLLALAFSDLILLFTAPLRQWIRHYWNIDIRQLGEVECRIHTFLTYASVHISSWLLVAVTLERVFSVMIPHRVKSGCTHKTAGITIGTVIVCIFGLNSHFLYGMGTNFVKQANATDKCSPKYAMYNHFSSTIFPWIDFCVAFLIPFVIITSGNIVIVVKLRLSRIQRIRMSSFGNNSSHSLDRNVSVTILLICLSIFFFISLAPVSIYFIGVKYWRADIISRHDTGDWEYLLFWYAVINCIGYLNATCNFFFYVLSGTKFRKEILNLVFCRNAGSQRLFGEN